MAPKGAPLCADTGHDYGNGPGVSTPLREGETQWCRNCDISRSLSEKGRLRYSKMLRPRKSPHLSTTSKGRHHS